MNKWEKEVQTSLLNSEAEVLKELEKLYAKALSDIKQSIKTFDAQIKSLDTVLQQGQQQGTLSPDQASQLISIRQSKVYQKEFQEALQGQVSDVLGNLLTRSYQSISDYLTDSYDNAFIGTMYDLNKQGLPFIFPIDQASVTRAVLLDSKISNGLYNALGLNVDDLKKRITQEISRGIAASRQYAEIARNLTAASGAPLSRTKTIIRTEGHRIQNAAVKDAQERAKAAGADVVKQWDATLDSLTRPDHQLLDGQIREINEPFEVNGKKADRPGEFGTPEEDCNCRCVMLTRARWALDEDELQILQERAAFFDLDKSKDFEDFKKKYVKAAAKTQIDITNGGQFERMTYSDENKYWDRMEHEFLTQNYGVREERQLWQKDGGYIQNGDGYKDINDKLRGFKDKYDNPKCRITELVMNRVTNNNSLQKDYIGFRKVDMSYLEKVLGFDISGLTKKSSQFPAFGGSRRVEIPKDKESAQIIADKISALVGTTNGTIYDKAYTSVSLSENLNFFTHYPIKFEIQMPKGTKGLITSNMMESEFIAKKDTGIEILGADVYNDGKKYIVRVFGKMVQ